MLFKYITNVTNLVCFLGYTWIFCKIEKIHSNINIIFLRKIVQQIMNLCKGSLAICFYERKGKRWYYWLTLRNTLFINGCYVITWKGFVFVLKWWNFYVFVWLRKWEGKKGEGIIL